MESCINVDADIRFQFNGNTIIPDYNLLKPPPGKALIKLGHLRILLLNELVQLIDTLDLLVTLLISVYSFERGVTSFIIQQTRLV